MANLVVQSRLHQDKCISLRPCSLWCVIYNPICQTTRVTIWSRTLLLLLPRILAFSLSTLLNMHDGNIWCASVQSRARSLRSLDSCQTWSHFYWESPLEDRTFAWDRHDEFLVWRDSDFLNVGRMSDPSVGQGTFLVVINLSIRLSHQSRSEKLCIPSPTCQTPQWRRTCRLLWCLRNLYYPIVMLPIHESVCHHTPPNIRPVRSTRMRFCMNTCLQSLPFDLYPKWALEILRDSTQHT